LWRGYLRHVHRTEVGVVLNDPLAGIAVVHRGIPTSRSTPITVSIATRATRRTILGVRAMRKHHRLAIVHVNMATRMSLSGHSALEGTFQGWRSRSIFQLALSIGAQRGTIAANSEGSWLLSGLLAGRSA
jgi:hypothetical protein